MKWSDVIADKRFQDAPYEQQVRIKEGWYKNNIQSDPRYTPELDERIRKDLFNEPTKAEIGEYGGISADTSIKTRFRRLARETGEAISFAFDEASRKTPPISLWMEGKQREETPDQMLTRLGVDAELAKMEASMPNLILQTGIDVSSIPLNVVGKVLRWATTPIRWGVQQLPIPEKYRTPAAETVGFISEMMAYSLLQRGAQEAVPRAKAVKTIHTERTAYKFLRDKAISKFMRNRAIEGNPVSRETAGEIVDYMNNGKYGKALTSQVATMPADKQVQYVNEFMNSMDRVMKAKGIEIIPGKPIAPQVTKPTLVKQKGKLRLIRPEGQKVSKSELAKQVSEAMLHPPLNVDRDLAATGRGDPARTVGDDIIQDFADHLKTFLAPSVSPIRAIKNIQKEAQTNTAKQFETYLNLKDNKQTDKFLKDNGLSVADFQDLMKHGDLSKVKEKLPLEEPSGKLESGKEVMPDEDVQAGPETRVNQPGTGKAGSGTASEQPESGRLSEPSGNGPGVSDLGTDESRAGERKPVREGIAGERSISDRGRSGAPSVTPADQPISPQTAYRQSLEESEIRESAVSAKQAESYAQKGSQKGALGADILSAYFTPPALANTMQEILKSSGGQEILEPSVGSGNLISLLSANNNVTGVEMNTLAAHVAKAKYPDAKIINTWSEKFFKDNDKQYDTIIMNPPYNNYASLFKGIYKDKETTYTNYFMREAAKALKPGGTIVALIPHSFIAGPENNAKKELLANGIELVNAYRIPSNIFEGDSAIAVDLLELKKTGNKNISGITNNEYFIENPEKVLGTIEKGKGNFGREIETIEGDLTNAINHIRVDYSLPAIEAPQVQKKTSTRKAKQSTEKTEEPQVAESSHTRKNVRPSETKALQDLYDNLDYDGSLKAPSADTLKMYDTDVNYYKGKYFPDFFYFFGNMRERLNTLEADRDKMSPSRYKMQKEKINSVLPQYKKAKDLFLDPRSGYFDEATINTFKDYLRRYQPIEGGISYYDMTNYLSGRPIQKDEHKNPEEYREKRRSATIKVFNQFLQLLEDEGKPELIDKINYDLFSAHIPDFKNYPYSVEDLSPTFKGKPLAIQEQQLEGAAFLVSRGLGYLAYEVGAGKTMTSILAIEKMLQLGRCKRPLILAPKGIVKNFMVEYKELFPKRSIVNIGNLGKELSFSKFSNNTVYVGSHEALSNITYQENTVGRIKDYLAKQVTKDSSGKRENEVASLKIDEKYISKTIAGGRFVEDMGFDLIAYDEAHYFKNLFSMTSSEFRSLGGATSDRAARAYMLSLYIMLNNNMQNVFMLSATPFNNQPIEIYSALSFIAHQKMEDMGLNNLYEFASQFADTDFSWTINKSSKLVKRQVTTGFKNATALRQLLRQYMLPKFSKDLNLVRPEKTRKTPTVEHTSVSKSVFENLEQDMLEAEVMSYPDKLGAIGSALLAYRNAIVSPYLTKYATSDNYIAIIENSPKLKYIVDQITNVYSDNTKAGQIIYLPIGISLIPHIKKYLIEKKGFKSNQVEAIVSATSKDQQTQIEKDFNAGKVKVLIGSSTIREGRNLQTYGAVMYFPLIEWNPTSVLQAEGRIYRQNNNFKEVYTVFPLLKDSSDSFYLQKMDEKAARFNDLWEGREDYVDVADIDPEEAKVSLVTRPENKADMVIQVEKDELMTQQAAAQQILSALKNLEFKHYYQLLDSVNVRARIKSIALLLNKAADSIIYNRDEIQTLFDEYRKLKSEISEADLNDEKNYTRIEYNDFTVAGSLKQLEAYDKRIIDIFNDMEQKTETFKETYKKSLEEFDTAIEAVEKKRAGLIEKYTKLKAAEKIESPAALKSPPLRSGAKPAYIGQDIAQSQKGGVTLEFAKLLLKPFHIFHDWILSFGKIKRFDPALYDKFVATYHELSARVNESIKEISDVIPAQQLTLQDRVEISYGVEEKDYSVPLHLKTVTEVFVKLFDDLENLLKENGIFKMGFIESRLAKNIEDKSILENKILFEQGNLNRIFLIERWTETIDKLNEEQDMLENLRYLPHRSVVRAVLDKKMASTPEYARPKFLSSIRRLSYKYQHRRGIIPLRVFVENGLLKPDDVDIIQLSMAALSEAKHRMIMKDLFDYGRDSGYIKHKNTRDIPHYWNTLNPVQHGIVAAEYNDYRIHPLFEAGLVELKNMFGLSSNPLKAFFSLVKVGQFYNPSIIWKYDIVQAAIGGVLGVKTPLYMAKALMSKLTHDDTFIEAEQNGVFQRPYLPGIGSKSERIKIQLAARATLKDLPFAVKLLEKLTDIPLTKENALDLLFIAYKAIWKATWAGDEIIRLSSYMAYKAMGYTEKEAGNLAATWHGSYSDISPKSKHAMSWLFFVYSFRILMPRQLWRVVYQPVSMALDQLSFGASGGKRGAVYPKRDWTRAIKGLVAAVLIPMLFHWYMRSKGFKTKIPLWKYSKQIGENEVVVGVNNIINQPIKWAARLSQYDPVKEDPRFIQGLKKWGKWELHPLYRIIMDIRDNRKSIGLGQIYNPSATGPQKVSQIMGYFARESFRILSTLFPDPSEEERGLYLWHLNDDDKREIISKTLNGLDQFIVDILGYKYVTPDKQFYFDMSVKQLLRERQVRIRKAQTDDERALVDLWYDNVMNILEHRLRG